jgi:hypothetical protein
MTSVGVPSSATMHTMRGIALLAGFVVTAVSCGGTVSVYERAGDSDAGLGGSATGGAGGALTAGAGGGAGGATAGSGGFAGAPECLTPVIDQGPSRIDEGPVSDNMFLQTPTLVQSELDPGLVTMVYHWQSWPGGTVTGIRFLPFQAWGPWPSEPIGPAAQPLPENMVKQGMRATLGPNDTIAVLSQHDDPNPTYHTEIGLHAFAAPFQTWPDGTSLHVPEDWEEPGMLFVVRGPDRFVVGWRGWDGNVEHHLRIGSVLDGSGFVPEAPDSTGGCASTPIVADATATGDTYLVASSVEKHMCCTCLAGPATNVLVRPLGKDPAQGLLIGGDDPVTYLKLSPRDDGAWLVIGRETAVGSMTVEVARVDKGGGLVSSPTPLPFDFFQAHPVAAQLGNHVAFAWVSQGKVHAATLSSKGVLAHGEFASPYAHDLGSQQLALLADNTGGKLLVAWAHKDDEQPEVRIHLARFAFGCEK